MNLQTGPCRSCGRSEWRFKRTRGYFARNCLACDRENKKAKRRAKAALKGR